MDKKLKDLCDMLSNDFREQIVELRLLARPFYREETNESINNEFLFCESYFLGLKLSRSESKPLDLRSTVQKFCFLLDINRYNKQDTNCRIMHWTRDQLDPELVRKF